MEDVKTASGYAMARDQAMGRLGLVWRRLKQFYAEVMLLGVDCFRKNRPEDVDVPLLGPDGMLDARMIRVADLKGNICVHPEADETFPRLKSQQRGRAAAIVRVEGSVDPGGAGGPGESWVHQECAGADGVGGARGGFAE